MNSKIVQEGDILLRQVFEKLGAASLIILANNFFVTLLNFAIMLILLSYLGIYNYGIYILLISIVGFGEQLSTLGIFPLIVTEISREQGCKNYSRVKTLLYRFALLQAAAGILIAAGIFAFSFFAMPIYGKEIGNALFVFSLYFLLFPLKNVFNVTFGSFLKFHYLAGFASFELLCRLILLFAAFHFFGAALFVVSVVFLISLIASLLAAGFLFVRLTSFLLKVAREKANVFFNLVKSIFVYGFITHQIKNAYMNLYPWLINLFLSVEAVGIFAVLLRVVSVMLRLLEPIEEGLLPIIASLQESKEQRTKLFSRLTKYTLAFGLVLMAASWLAMPFIPLIIGSSFKGNELAFLFLALVLPIYALNMTIRPVLFKEQEQRFITGTVFISLVASVSFGAILMPKIGLIGAAIGYVAFQFVNYLIQRQFLKRKYGLSFNYAIIFSFDDVDRKLIYELKKLILSFPKKIARKLK